MTTRLTRFLVTAACLAIASPLAAQKSAGTAGAKKSAVAKPVELVGTWSGTATVTIGDSTITVPVNYVFTQGAGGIAGTATVPGQGSGPISNVVRDGSHVQFRVTAPEARLLEHDGKIGADGNLEGIVNLGTLPIAKFKIAPKK